MLKGHRRVWFVYNIKENFSSFRVLIANGVGANKQRNHHVTKAFKSSRQSQFSTKPCYCPVLRLQQKTSSEGLFYCESEGMNGAEEESFMFAS